MVARSVTLNSGAVVYIHTEAVEADNAFTRSFFHCQETNCCRFEPSFSRYATKISTFYQKLTTNTNTLQDKENLFTTHAAPKTHTMSVLECLNFKLLMHHKKHKTLYTPPSTTPWLRSPSKSTKRNKTNYQHGSSSSPRTCDSTTLQPELPTRSTPYLLHHELLQHRIASHACMQQTRTRIDGCVHLFTWAFVHCQEMLRYHSKWDVIQWKYHIIRELDSKPGMSNSAAIKSIREKGLGSAVQSAGAKASKTWVNFVGVVLRKGKRWVEGAGIYRNVLAAMKLWSYLLTVTDLV